jgi:type I restriction enzyme S subunit
MTTERELPAGWRVQNFGQIAESITERVDDPSSSGLDHYVGLEHLDPDTPTISRWGSPSEVEATKLRFYPGDVIYARRRAYQRKLGVAEWDGIASAHALVLRARPEVCLPEFLPYFLQSDQFHHRALDISVGSLSPTINWKTLAIQSFSIPPVPEQQRIVEVLLTASEHARALVNTVEHSQRLLESLRDSAGALAQRDGGRVALSALAQVVDCEHKTAPDGSGPYQIVGTPDIRDGEVDLRSARYVSEETYGAWTRRGAPRSGDLIFTREAPVGEVARVELDGMLCLGQRTVLVRPVSDESGRWLYHMLQAPVLRRLIQARAGGTTTPHLNVGDIRGLPIPALPDDWSLVEKAERALVLRRRAVAAVAHAQPLVSNLREHLVRGADQ